METHFSPSTENGNGARADAQCLPDLFAGAGDHFVQFNDGGERWHDCVGAFLSKTGELAGELCNKLPAIMGGKRSWPHDYFKRPAAVKACQIMSLLAILEGWITQLCLTESGGFTHLK